MKKYYNIDGLRTMAAIGIVIMHVRANLGYDVIGGGENHKLSYK